MRPHRFSSHVAPCIFPYIFAYVVSDLVQLLMDLLSCPKARALEYEEALHNSAIFSRQALVNMIHDKVSIDRGEQPAMTLSLG